MNAACIELSRQLEEMTEKNPSSSLTDKDVRERLCRAAKRLLEGLEAPYEPTTQDTRAKEPLQTPAGSEEKNDSPPTQPALTADDLNGLQKCVFDWADSYDQKDWQRLAENVAPEIDLDYTSFGMQRWPRLTPAAYIATVSAPTFIGNPMVMCQHLVGATHWERIGPDEVRGRHQIRAAHQIYTDATLTEVKLKGHAHASNVHKYKRIEGVWKLAGVKPKILWSEYDFDRVWAHAKETKE